ncbi:MAG TPA: hypothetical protein VHP81_07910, partial [Lachnospiraceae bacterium]|nr:hypothetical protein [Lachnospiraceae bacterium]
MSSYTFKQAKPIWSKERSKEKNVHLSFKTIVAKEKDTLLTIAASSVYRIYINGVFFCIGPARACTEYYKVDQFDITSMLIQNK